MIFTLANFYTSKVWENFRSNLMDERTNEKGQIICAHCGKPIVKAYDCIGHHKIELTDENVNDYTISLNPELVELIHFRCHNELHQRFGYAKPKPQKRVFIVYGAPCSGKTTWVNSVATKQDLILDVDRLWSAIKADCCGEFEKPNELTTNVFALRDYLLDMIKVRRGRWHNAYIIGGYPLQGERERIADSVNADRLIFIDTPKEVCLARAKLKSSEWIEFVNVWFDRYSPPLSVIKRSCGGLHKGRYFSQNPNF